MNGKFWEEYYKNHPSDAPSAFALFTEPLLPRNTTILDIGAGNRRDTNHFENMGHYVYPVDQVLGRSIEDLIQSDRKAEVAYLRWIIHAIEPELMVKLVAWLKTHARFIFIETRTIQDTTYKKDHDRYPVDTVEFLNLLSGTKLVYVKQGYGMSKTKLSDPHLMRLVCETLR